MNEVEKSMTETEKAWLAGIIDGEGCIYARMEKTGYLKSSVQVIMAHLPTMERISQITGGNAPKPQTPAPSNKHKAWRIQFQAQRGATLLRQLLPYLVTKKRQAEIFIQLMEDKGSRLARNVNRWELVASLKSAKTDEMEVLSTS
jgi:hypothetical protein